MKRAIPAAVVTAALTLSLTACGGGSVQSTASSLVARASSAASAAASAASAAASEAPSTGTVDCGTLTKDDLGKWIVYTQLLIGAGKSKDGVASLKSQQVSDYTPDKFAAILAKLDVLKGHGALGFDDPTASLDFFAHLNDLMGTMIAGSDVTQAQRDEYAAAAGSTGSAIGKQLPVNAALSQYCPKVS
jgi:hypothetical protein